MAAARPAVQALGLALVATGAYACSLALDLDKLGTTSGQSASLSAAASSSSSGHGGATSSVSSSVAASSGQGGVDGGACAQGDVVYSVGNLVDLKANDDYVFFAFGDQTLGELQANPLDGGAPLHRVGQKPAAVWITKDHFYWVNYTGGIYRVSASDFSTGYSPLMDTPIGCANDNPRTLTGDGTRVFAIGCGRIVSDYDYQSDAGVWYQYTNVGGGTVLGTSLAVSDSLYWAAFTSTTHVLHREDTSGKNGSAVPPVDEKHALSLAADAKYLYGLFADDADGGPEQPGVLRRRDNATNQWDDLVKNIERPGRIAVDDAFVYFTLGGPIGGPGALMRVDKTPGAMAECMAADVQEPSVVAVNQKSVFWLDKGSSSAASAGRVMHLAKP